MTSIVVLPQDSYPFEPLLRDLQLLLLILQEVCQPGLVVNALGLHYGSSSPALSFPSTPHTFDRLHSLGPKDVCI